MRPVLSKGPGREGWFFLYNYENGFQWSNVDILYITQCIVIIIYYAWSAKITPMHSHINICQKK